jgi:predicted transposase YbfD/YdcC
MYPEKFFSFFKNIDEMRQEEKVWHRLEDLIFLVVSAVISGCNQWTEIHLWATREVNIKWMRRYIELENGIPSLSTIRRFFEMVRPKEFEKSMINWMRTISMPEQRDCVSLDGKTMSGSADGDKKGAHIISALCASKGLVIGQVKTSEKSNEITAIPELLDKLYLEGCIITIDAMGCQKKIVEKIVKDCKADYVLNLKDNQETLSHEVQDYFEDLKEDGTIEKLNTHYEDKKNVGKPFGDGKLQITKTFEKGHGRIEKRTYIFSTDTNWMTDAKKDWKGLSGIGMVTREIEKKGKKSVENSFFIASITKVDEFSKSVRKHWLIESMHWVLDVTFKDDENKTRKGNAPNNMGVLKRIAYNVVKSDIFTYPKKSIKDKRMIAYTDHVYREMLLASSFGLKPFGVR